MGDESRDFGCTPGRVKRERVGPDQAEAFTDLGIAQAVERDAEALCVRELAIVLSGQAEVAIELEAVADIDDDQERRPAVVCRKRLGVALGLTPSALHGDAPVLGAPDGGAFPCRGFHATEKGQLFFELLIRTLLRLHDEGVAAIQVDRAGAGRAIRVGEPDRVFEPVVIARGIGGSRARPIDAQHVAQLRGEQLKVGALGGAGSGPTDDEGIDRVRAVRLSLARSHTRSRLLLPRSRIARESRQLQAFPCR
jgi:hypothetical protein